MYPNYLFVVVQPFLYNTNPQTSSSLKHFAFHLSNTWSKMFQFLHIGKHSHIFPCQDFEKLNQSDEVNWGKFLITLFSNTISYKTRFVSVKAKDI